MIRLKKFKKAALTEISDLQKKKKKKIKTNHPTTKQTNKEINKKYMLEEEKF